MEKQGLSKKLRKKVSKKSLPIFSPKYLCTIEEMSNALGVTKKANYARRSNSPHIYTLLDTAVFCKINKLDNDFLRKVKILRGSH